MISVIIPVYNRKQKVLEAATSVLSQTWEDWELVIVDDGSDYPIDLLDFPSDPRIRLYRQNHSGVSSARNLGVQKSEGEWISFLDSDDVWLPEKLEKQMEYMAHSEYRICQTTEKWIRNGKEVIVPSHLQKREGNLFSLSLKRCMITPSSVLMERSLWEEIGEFDGRLPSCEDYDYWLRVTCKYKVGLLPQNLLVRYGGHPDQLSFRYPVMDRFRIVGMLKLYSSGQLDSDQSRLLLQELEDRWKILEQGRQKRQLPWNRQREAYLEWETTGDASALVSVLLDESEWTGKTNHLSSSVESSKNFREKPDA